MSLTAGTRLGPYEIVSQVGAGGMGEVYRATDTRLDRTVAIKVLPEHLASDPGRRERFEREAKAVSSLNHPHICTLYDVGVEDGIHYLVMELVEGETLESRLANGRLPLDQALEYAIQIADALDKAHRQGVVHRDFKPGNIMLTKSGVKLLDFGLAKLKGDAAPTSGVSQAPTQENLTAEGTIIGTLQYMAPEQLEGEEADARTDIFAFGAVVYEMVTGKKAFEGNSQASLISSIMSAEPQAMGELQEMTPGSLDHVVRVCLAKDRDDRWQTATDLLREMKWTMETGPEQVIQARATGRRVPLAWAFALVLVALVAILLGAWLLLPDSPPALRVTDIVTPATPSFLDFALSPDGTKLVYSAYDEDGIAKLFLRSLDSIGSDLVAVLEGTENPSGPFWSPDNQSIGFFVEGSLKRVDLDTGSVETLTRGVSGGAWGTNDTILFNSRTGISLVSAAGGEPSVVSLDAPGLPLTPTFLPDGERFLFYIRGADGGVYMGQLGQSETQHILDADAPGSFLPPDKLLFVRQGSLRVADFDPERPEDPADSRPIAPRVSFGTTRLPISVSDTGTVVYRSNPGNSRFVWVDRSGASGSGFDIPTAQASNPDLSPDNSELAFESTSDGVTRISILDLERGDVVRQLPSEGLTNGEPTWSPDGLRIAFMATGGVGFNLHIIDSDFTSEPQAILLADESDFPTDWSPDGEHLLFHRQGASGDSIWAVPADEGDAFEVVDSAGNDSLPLFSPDGNWIAYESDRQQGQPNIYVERFRAEGAATLISSGGGTQVRWGPDGDELFYIALDGNLMWVSIQLPSEGNTPEVGDAVALFPSRIPAIQYRGHQYDISNDGQRFLINEITDSSSYLTHILNLNAILEGQ